MERLSSLVRLGPSCSRQRIVPFHRPSIKGHLTDDEATKILELDRCLRFFFICTVLQSLEIEQKAVIRAYYFYLNVLRHTTERHELSVYLKSSYPRLSKWLTINTPALDEYGRTGVWRPVDSC